MPEVSESESKREARIRPVEGNLTSFEDEANRLGLDQESREYPSTREFVGLVHAVQELHDDFSRAQWEPIGGPMIDVPEGSHSLADRYASAELLLAAVVHVVEEGLHGPEEDSQAYLRSKLNSALGRYGLEVQSRPESPEDR